MTRLLALAVLLPGCAALGPQHEDSVTFTPDLAGVSRVELRSDAGDVRITRGDAARLDGLAWWRGDERPDVRVEVVDDALVVDVRCADRVFLACAVDWELTLPADLAFELETGAGDVDLDVPVGDAWVTTGAGDVRLVAADGDVAVTTGAGDAVLSDVVGDLDVETGSGDVRLDGIDGDLTLVTGSGKVDARGVCADVLDVTTGSGDVDVTTCAAPYDARLETGTGDVDLQVPEGRYAVEARTGVGQVDISGIVDASDAERRIRVRTGAGDVRLRGR